MKKTIILLLLVSIFFIGKNVYAEETITYTAGDYKYEINKFAIRVYKVINSEDGETTNETFGNFQANRFEREIDLDADDIIINPSAEAKTIDKINAQVVSLNATISDEKLRELLSPEILAATDTENYIGELVIYYKVTEAPEKFKKYYTVNFYKELIKQFIESLDEAEDYNFVSNVNEVSLNEELVQPIQYLTIQENLFEVFETAEDTEPPLLLFNYFQLSENEYNDDEEPTDILMFTNISDLDYFINVLSEALSDEDDYYEDSDTGDLDIPGGKITTSENVAVPDTAMNKEMIVIIAGFIMILLGSGIALRTVIKNN